MKIVSIIKDSFQEYEGQQSLVLFSLGCNMKCFYCYNYNDVTDKNNVIGNAKEVINKHITPMHDAVVFLGGEPTIWGSELIEAAKHAKERGFKVKIYTNGLRPDVVKKLNENNYVDAYAVDLKTLDDDLEEVLGIKITLSEYVDNFLETVESIRFFKKDLEIRTTNYKGLDIEKIKSFLFDNYPNIKHIINEDFRENIKDI